MAKKIKKKTESKKKTAKEEPILSAPTPEKTEEKVEEKPREKEIPKNCTTCAKCSIYNFFEGTFACRRCVVKKIMSTEEALTEKDCYERG